MDMSIKLFFISALVILSLINYSDAVSSKKVDSKIMGMDGLEKCLKLEPSEVLQYSFSSSKPLEFNLHYHLLDKTVFHIREVTKFREETFYPLPDQKVYCLDWRNTDADDVDLSYQYSIEKG